MAMIYLVLKTTVEEEFVDLIDDSLGDLDDALHIDLTYADLQIRGEYLLVHEYETSTGEVRVSLVEDSRTPVGYVAIEAPTQETLDGIAKFFRERLPVEDLKSLQHSACRAVETAENPGVLIKLAIASDEPDEETERIIREALESEDVTVLGAALEAASLTRWATFAGVLAEHYARHADRDVRELAGRALGALLQGNPSGS